MIKIRPSIFETNSSSNDYYNDMRRTKAHQKVRILLKWNSDVAMDRQDAIISDMDNSSVLDKVADIIDSYYEDASVEVNMDDEDTITVEYEITVNAYMGPAFPGTRYSAPELGDVFFEDPEEGIPLRNEPFPEKPKIVEQIKELFNKRGYSEIEDIEDIYAEPWSEDEAYDNLG